MEHVHALEVMEDCVRVLAIIDEPRTRKLYRVKLRIGAMTALEFPERLRDKFTRIEEGLRRDSEKDIGNYAANEIDHEVAKLICELAFELNREWGRSEGT